jgi:hypothetical protein
MDSSSCLASARLCIANASSGERFGGTSPSKCSTRGDGMRGVGLPLAESVPGWRSSKSSREDMLTCCLSSYPEGKSGAMVVVDEL